MEKMIEGILEFREKDFEEYRSLFEGLGRKQNPHTLFIGCSDSRIVPNLITKTLPGELFMIRNIANIVPKYRQSKEFLATTSAIEYAVQILNVENIVVCGHSNCGGCASLYFNDQDLEKIPHTKKWLELAHPVRDLVIRQFPKKDDPTREWLTEQLNVVEQIKHLYSYPFISQKVEENKIKIFGWYYLIQSGEIFNFNESKHLFELIK
ncbi:MAG TPA: carbonic anhydrase [Ignavibacteriaceae bacterium]|nr:carbonic anhydrase [Ignavibacteriaceae bacterium]